MKQEYRKKEIMKRKGGKRGGEIWLCLTMMNNILHTHFLAADREGAIFIYVIYQYMLEN